jgi:hypothetical protein
MSKRSIHDFGVVDEKGDFYEFRWVDDAFGECRLDGVIQTERGPRRTELAVLPARIWTLVSERTIRELAAGMGETEQTKKAPTLKVGINRLSPLIGRELAVLLWALMESDSDSNIEAILHGWRELAREERWWLYAKGAAPGQRTGAGWRLALFHALSETTDNRSPESVPHEKKKPGSGYRPSKKAISKKQSESRKSSNGYIPEQKTSNTTSLPKLIPQTTAQSKKQPASPPTSDLTKSEKQSQPEKKVRKLGRTATTNN